MIVVDTSSLIAILLDEPEGSTCIAALEADDDLHISAGTVANALIVTGQRNVSPQMKQLLDGLGFGAADVTSTTARRIGDAYAIWVKGAHPAALNLGDYFAYDLAKELGCALLHVGSDFAQTDVLRVL